MKKKYVCVHGHFYQPPRENAWLEKIEYQDSASPYHDWNERITTECYAPNGVSRILNDERSIVDIVNNYARMSFNFGPTLLNWLEINRPKTYSGILEADARSMQLFNGHGSALAQVYNHIIMPLASKRDKETQVIWGLADFKRRFGRDASGMWLAETAVDTDTLEVLADHGVQFTILAPRQAKRYRESGSSTWVSGCDTKVPYVCHLPSGKRIKIFFYDGDRSQAVAFKGLLKDGKEFANYLIKGFDDRDTGQLVHIATDGESYGHHHRHGDMALAYCIRYIQDNDLAEITNYSAYLELEPPRHEVEIHESSSWSCVHGVERWRADCGCSTGGKKDWNQKWRAPLRHALDWLRDELAKIYEAGMDPYHEDPWALRNAYYHIIVDRNVEKTQSFLKENIGDLSAEEQTHVIRLLEMQRHEQLMYTSCAWFFDEISGIETIQVLQYAARAIQLAESQSDALLEDQFESLLAKAQSNLSKYGNGAEIYKRLVLPSRLSLTQIGMHYAVSSLFAEDPEEITVFNYRCKSTHFQRIVQGTQRLSLGRTHVTSKVTLSHKHFSYVVLYFGQHHLIGKAFEDMTSLEYEEFVAKVLAAFKQSNLTEVIELFREYPNQRSFSFFDMFKDEQIKMLNSILEYSLKLAASSYQKIHDRNYNLLNVMQSSHLQPPKLLVQNLEMVMNIELRRLFSTMEEPIDILELEWVIGEIRKWNFHMDFKELNFLSAGKLERMLQDLGQLTNGNSEKGVALLRDMQHVLELIAKVGIIPDLNHIQDYIFSQIKTLDGDITTAAKEALLAFAEHINIDVQPILQRRQLT